VPCPVNTITYKNITSAPGTAVKAWIDFEGLLTNTIEGVSIHSVRHNGEKSTTCKLVKGTYSDCVACPSCEGLKPATVRAWWLRREYSRCQCDTRAVVKVQHR
jgi:hypothetical protein